MSCLPQAEVRQALKLVSVGELADVLGLTYRELRWQIKSGRIPAPTKKIVKRCYYKANEAISIIDDWKQRQI